MSMDEWSTGKPSSPSSRSGSQKDKMKLEYTFARTFKNDVLQVQKFSSQTSCHPDPSFNIRKLKRNTGCSEGEVSEFVYDVKHYEVNRSIVQYNKLGVLFYPTSKSCGQIKKGSPSIILWKFEKKMTAKGMAEFKIVDYTANYTVGKWKKSQSDVGGWTLKRKNKETGEKVVLARYHVESQILDIFPNNFIGGSDIVLDQVHSQESLQRSNSFNLSKTSSFSSDSSSLSETSKAAAGGAGTVTPPISDADRLKFSEAIVFSLLSLRLNLGLADSALVVSSSLSNTCALFHPEIFLHLPDHRLAYSLTAPIVKKGPMIMKKVLAGGLKR